VPKKSYGRGGKRQAPASSNIGIDEEEAQIENSSDRFEDPINITEETEEEDSRPSLRKHKVQ
jgi:hypothetical protein